MEEKVDWVEKAIEYEATPKSLREPKTTTEFYTNLGIPESTYYYTISKEANQKKIVDLCFQQAKKRTPEILKKLGEKAEAGNDQSISQFLEYVLEVKKRLDITSNDKEITPIYGGQSKILRHDGDKGDLQAEAEDQSSSGRNGGEQDNINSDLAD